MKCENKKAFCTTTAKNHRDRCLDKRCFSFSGEILPWDGDAA